MTVNGRGVEMIAVVSVLISLSLTAVCLRAVARLKRHVRFGVDDYLSFFSGILMISMLVELILWCTIGGDGRHSKDLDLKTMIRFGKLFIANQFSYFFVCPAIKTSIICFYRRIFTTRKFQQITFAVNTLILTWGLAIIIACALQCRPLAAAWDPRIPGKCFKQNVYLVTNQVFNVVIDFVILALPVPMIWNLQRPWQDKLALNGVFALGIFVCFASIYRIVVLFWINPADQTFTVYQATLWTHIEPSIGLTCACLPIIRGLFPKLKFPASNKQRYASAPYYLSGEHSISHFATSTGPRSSDIDHYIKMDDGLSRPDTGSHETVGPLDFKKDSLGTGAIAVRTEIDVTADAASSEPGR